MMKTTARWGFSMVIVLLLAVWIQAGYAVVLDTNVKDGYTEYLGVTGTATDRNAPYRLIVPDAWNGGLLIYVRGTGSSIMVEVVNGQSVRILDPDSRLPIVGVTPLANTAGAVDNAGAIALEAELLGQDYALVASDFKPEPRFVNEGLLGWSVEDGLIDTLAVTQEARSILRLWHGRPPQRLILWARSQGSLIGLRLAEMPNAPYDGFISGCTVGAGTPRAWDVAIGIALAYDVAFAQVGGWNEAKWGSIGGGDLPYHLSFARDVAPTLAAQVSNPSNFGLFEFIRLVNDLPLEGFYPAPENPQFNWLFIDMLFLTEVRADLEAKAEGAIAQNIGHVYRLSAEERAYLAGLGIEADALLRAMNRRATITADPWARLYVERFADLYGKIQRPVISMHTTVDGLVPPAHESAYRESVEEAGKSAKLVQVYAHSVGHCTFTLQQWLTTVDAMSDWLTTGIAPDRQVFPAALGFDHRFVPPPWPQPE
jgi:pimeloyl-ACP methyl ester carboxylesterase